MRKGISSKGQTNGGPPDPQVSAPQRRWPVGAEVDGEGKVSIRTWAPRSKVVAVERWTTEGAPANPEDVVSLTSEGGGYFSGILPGAKAGTLYKLRLDTGSFPDPASRYQPQGPHGPSQIIDPRQFHWTDNDWRGVAPHERIVYEMHVGTFTQEGTWKAAAQMLPHLAELGITIIEILPVAEFPGKFGWGYDGVDLFAPTRLYGSPEDFRDFVNQAHGAGLGVILDVVYNHFGPDGNYLKEFSDTYFTDRYANEWGEAINFDGNGSEGVREYFIANAAYWIEEFHLDGLRLDATQSIFDSSPDHILTAIIRQIRSSPRGEKAFIVAENETQEINLVRPIAQGGNGVDAVWNDDFHHTAMVSLTGRAEAYYSDYQGHPQEFISALKWGFLFQGQFYRWQKKRRGTPAIGAAPWQFVIYLQNHDQIANSLRGLRLHQMTSPGHFRALTAVWLLAPSLPMLFQGQEFAASTPFLYFADHNPDLAKLVSKGRREFLAQFRSIGCKEAVGLISDPESEETFQRCKLNWKEREEHALAYQLHRDLIRLRKEDPVFSRPTVRGLDGAVLASEAFVLRYFGAGGDDRLLLVNFGVDLNLDPAPEPLIAPVQGRVWQMLWTSENCDYGGFGTPPLIDDQGRWLLPGQSAIVLKPAESAEDVLILPAVSC